jgi:hypothetical protein
MRKSVQGALPRAANVLFSLFCARARKETANHVWRNLLRMQRRRLLALIAALAVASPAAWASEEASKKKSGGASYLPLAALTGATNKSGGRRGVLTVECALDVQDTALRQRADASLPRLRAAYLQTVLAYAAGLPAGAAPNVDFIGASLQRQTDQILGRPGARLLLGTVLVN